jgi:hypothetical protein
MVSFACIPLLYGVMDPWYKTFFARVVWDKMTTTIAVCLWLALAGPEGGPEAGWKRVAESEGITVYQREVPNSRIREVKAIGELESPVERVWEVINDVLKYPQFMPYMKETRFIADAGNGAQYVYHYIDPPFIDQRDYTLKLSNRIDAASKTYERHWTMAAEGIGPAPRKGVVRLSLCDGAWILKATGPHTTKVTYWVYTDPGGAVPLWIVNKANHKSLPEVVQAVGHRALDPKWKK